MMDVVLAETNKRH